MICNPDGVVIVFPVVCARAAAGAVIDITAASASAITGTIAIVLNLERRIFKPPLLFKRERCLAQGGLRC